MSFQVSTRQQAVSGSLDGTIHVLESRASGDRAEVWPALGFNCIHWSAEEAGQTLDLLYSDPQLFANGRPTRSGIPVLFPFPNRIRDGKFSWEGQDYLLPTNDPTQKNAIHGFACRHSWRVVDQGANEASAWITGEFLCSRDAPADRPLWPADHQLRLTIRLERGQLSLHAEVYNPDRVNLPFGLGYHPYFRVPLGGGTPEECLIQVPAARYWELRDNLPTGRQLPVDGPRDLTTARAYASLQVDDVLTGILSDALSPPLDPRYNGAMHQGERWLGIASSPAFRELVVFTPPHRQAFCLEPYTCVTDAINLHGQGVDTGLKILPPGQRWTGDFVLRLWGKRTT